MIRAAILALALAATPAAANHYKAQPEGAAPAGRFVVKDSVWSCGAGGCTGARSNSRPAIVCAALVREVGRVRSFASGDAELGAEQLEKCNARAR